MSYASGKSSKRLTKDALLAEQKALCEKVAALESERETALARATTAECELHRRTEKWREAEADRDALLTMLRTARGRAGAAVLVRLLTPVELDEKAVEGVRRWEETMVAAINRDAAAKVAKIEAEYQQQIAAINRVQTHIDRTLKTVTR